MDVNITGGAGRLQGVFQKGTNDKMALILPGNMDTESHMDDRVSYSMFLAFARQGFSTLRFNFRGTGLSQGKIEEPEEDILEDASSALDFLKNKNSDNLDQNVWIVGNERGAYAGMQLLMRRPEVKKFISISPSVNKFDFSFLTLCPCSGLIIHPDLGNEMKGIRLESLARQLNEQKDIDIKFQRIEGANSSFDTGLKELYKNIEDYIVTEQGKEERLL